jgi:hypothetical protein
LFFHLLPNYKMLDSILISVAIKTLYWLFICHQKSHPQTIIELRCRGLSHC